MKGKFLSFGTVFLMILVSSARPADILGTWIARISFFPEIGETVFSFKAEGETLTGTVSFPRGQAAISEGKMHGNEISFFVVGDPGVNGMTAEYKGKVGLNEIKFTRTPKDGTGQALEFIAKREFLRHNDYIQRQIVSPVPPPRFR